MKELTDKETADYLRKWVVGEYSHGVFAWPTDGCGYEQHIKFVKHRNNNWKGGDNNDFNRFVLEYAERLSPTKEDEK
jgi:hypothetical protein